MDKIKQTENEVLKVYQKVNPSRHDISTDDLFEQHKKKRQMIFQDKLKFSVQMFLRSRVIDFGAGTGENSIMYHEWGCDGLTCVEVNPDAVKILRELMRDKGYINDTIIIPESIYKFKSKESYDIVTCDGVLNHVNDAELGFKKIVKNLEQYGFVIISVGNPYGAFQRNLQKYALYYLSKNEDELVENASILFEEHINRAVKYGNRTAKAVIYDSYVNPKTNCFYVKDVLKWFNDNNICFYSSWPPLQLPFNQCDSANRTYTDFAQPEYQGVFTDTELQWMIAKDSDTDNILLNKDTLLYKSKHIDIVNTFNDMNKDMVNTINLVKYIDELDLRTDINWQKSEGQLHFNKFFREVIDFLIILSTRDIQKIAIRIKEYEQLFKGSCGLGDVFYVGYKK